MKKTINLGLVCVFLSLLACEDPKYEPCKRGCVSAAEPVIVQTVHPRKGTVGEQVVLIVSNMPDNATYDGRVYPTEGQNNGGPWVSATVGNKSATVLSVSYDAVTIEVPQSLEPGSYQVMLNVGGQAVNVPGEFEVLSPKL